ncbi:hypothetical protein PLESTB_001856700 [Pleodorina starrii]|uniref:Fe/B12 periplasmic-binding domain-containing protein n=1 Tax=Pleodorina starrii TaxID=330485 RepID=A0A9W6FAW0_9CHLO|nr:hypothetical protein PLESTM_000590600 [Pleodorina starrii]GLC62220.1 hypothetical protein PLESTB_001856700 [Pleodorina starrii]GLC74026.1 hypothetical protein PLESTF_001451600 [Pleodorina starrii]
MQRKPSAKAPGATPVAASLPALRVLSLLPGATDTVRALGAADLLVGRTHECDWPELQRLPAITSDKLGPMQPADLDAAMSACSGALPTLGWCGGGAALLDQGLSPYRTDVERLAELRPDVILTQMQGLGPDLSPDHFLVALEQLLGYRPVVVHLAALEMEGVWADMRAISEALKLGREGAAAIQGLQRRLQAASEGARGRHRPRVAVVQWPDPLFAAGGWVPQLVEMAGARDVLGRVEEAATFTAQQLADARPDVLVFGLCGFGLAESQRLAAQALEQLTAACGGGSSAAAEALRRARVIVTDGLRVFSRPGPWLIPSLEVLVEALHGEAQGYGHEGRLWALMPPSPGAVAATAPTRGSAGIGGVAGGAAT